MADNIDRQSLTTSLEDRYKNWSGAAKIPSVNNFVDQSNTFSNNFTKGAQVRVTSLTDKALNYSDTMGVSRKKYKG